MSMYKSLKIIFPGLNQLYITKGNIVDFKSLYRHFIEKVSKALNVFCPECKFDDIEEKLANEFRDVVEMYRNNIDLYNFEEVELKILSCLKTIISFYSKSPSATESINPEFLNNPIFFDFPEVLFFVKDYFDEFAQDNLEIVLYSDHTNVIYSYLDFKILCILGMNHFRQSSYYSAELNLEPYSFVFLHEDLQILNKYHSLGSWIGLICNMNFTNIELDEDFKICHIVRDNIDFTRTFGKIFDFSCSFFYQMKIVYNFITEARGKLSKYFYLEQETDNNLVTYSRKVKDSQLLEVLISEANIIKVITLIKVLFDYSNYKKSRFVRSSEKILFLPHIGGDDININGHFHGILHRIIYSHDILYYKNLISSIENTIRLNPKILLLDGLNNLDIFIERKLMTNFLQTFVSSNEIKSLNEEYNLEVKFPESVYVNLAQFTDLDVLEKIMQENKLKLPLILKFEGEKDSEMKHLMIIIVSKNGLRNVIEYLSKYEKEDNFCVIQNFNNHGGYVLKQYRYNTYGKVFFRPSMPDLYENYENEYEELKKGYLSLQTSDMATDNFKSFWGKFKNEEGLESLVNYEYLNKVSDVFQKVSDKTLFGLDYLYDFSNKTYYLVDCNNFPGYKEIDKEFNNYLTKHFLTYYNKHLETFEGSKGEECQQLLNDEVCKFNETTIEK